MSLPPVWREALALFHEHLPSLQSERALVQSRRFRDELDYAHTFRLTWPAHESPQPTEAGNAGGQRHDERVQ